MNDPKVMKAKFTDIQNQLMELHDAVFPNTKHISPEDSEFIRSCNRKSRPGTKLVPKSELDTYKSQIVDYIKEVKDLQDKLDAVGNIVEAARDLLRNYEKDTQYPENTTIHFRYLDNLRNAIFKWEDT